MADHVYADRDQFWQYLADQGADQYRADDALVLGFLKGSSRAIDAYCRRSGSRHVMSGFGPRTGINWYDTAGESELDLDDDLLAMTSFEVATGTGQPLVSWVDGTGYLLQPYTRTPQRTLVPLDGYGLGTGLKVAKATGKWGYSDVRSAALASSVPTGGWTSNATVVTFAGDPSDLAIGQTLWCDSEALLVTDLTGAGATVVRGAHGTTPAIHTQTTALYRQLYDSNVQIATLQIALRRWKHRATGLSGDYGGMGGVPSATEKAAENDILRSYVGDLAFRGRG